MRASGGNLSNRGGGKTRSGGGTVTVTKEKKRATAAINDAVLVLRAALFTPTGRDKDVTEGIAPAFMKYDRNGLDLKLEFTPKLMRSEVDWTFDITKEYMEDRYDASGYGWDDEDKRRELTEQGARFILVRENNPDDAAAGHKQGKLVGFVHFRFTVQGEIMDTMAGEPCLYLWDIQLEEKVQRKGLGKHLLTLLELIARREKMKHVAVPIQMNDEWACGWISKMKGYGPDMSLADLVGFDAETEGFEVYSKALVLPAAAQNRSELAMAAEAGATTKISMASPKVSAKLVQSTGPSPSSIADLASSEEADSSERTDAIDTSKIALKLFQEGEAESSSCVEDDVEDVDQSTDLSSLDEDAVIKELQKMFQANVGRSPTEEEIQNWLETVKELKDSQEVDKLNESTDSDGFVVVEDDGSH